MFIITKWFGVFLIDEDNKIVEKILFPKNIEDIADRLERINNGEILEEELEITRGRSVSVFKRRLSSIGEFIEDFEDKIDFDISPSDFNYPMTLLHDASIRLMEKLVDEQLRSKDLQIIQMVDTLDELIHIMNLLSGRYSHWSILPGSANQLVYLQNLISQVDGEIHRLQEDIDSLVQIVAPNTSSILGSILTARLISLAGGLKQLSLLPASTIQILGAEKAFFRFRREGGKPPKHGIIFQHPFINKTPLPLRGRYARFFASRISLALKADFFTRKDIRDLLRRDLEEFSMKNKKVK
ncbi:MAG: hypothetical protein DRN12_07510 [Thermoplasmata archaeon]|nr:MAG: hypothetical protein DRN12_07510 [Thermoplasmata archaeon]